MNPSYTYTLCTRSHFNPPHDAMLTFFRSSRNPRKCLTATHFLGARSLMTCTKNLSGEKSHWCFPIYKNHPKKEVELEYEVLLRGWYRGGIVRDSFKEVNEHLEIRFSENSSTSLRA